MSQTFCKFLELIFKEIKRLAYNYTVFFLFLEQSPGQLYL